MLTLSHGFPAVWAAMCETQAEVMSELLSPGGASQKRFSDLCWSSAPTGLRLTFC